MKIIKNLKLHNTADIQVDLVKLNNAYYVMKQAAGKGGMTGLQREYHNQLFLHEYSQENDLGFVFYRPKWHGDWLLYPYLDLVKWLANNEHSINQSFDTYKNIFGKFIQQCHRIDYSEIPDSIKKDSDERTAGLHDKFEVDLKFIKNQALVNMEEVQLLRSRFEAHIDKKAFQHHDVVPWHMATAKNGFYLIDAGWATWSLWGYDIAYYILQMIGCSSQIDDAKNCYKYMKALYDNMEDFNAVLNTSLAYRGV